MGIEQTGNLISALAVARNNNYIVTKAN